MDSAAVLVLIVGLAVVAAWWLRGRGLRWADSRQERIQLVCEDAKAVVDLATPIDHMSALPDTVTLSALMKRIHHLDARLRPLAANERSARVTEAIEDVRRVAGSLAAALDAERSLRLSSPKGATPQRARSSARIAERSAELDAAADELQWLVQTGP
ncbi:MAG: hypothetical protein ACR2QO_04515 [Acidimicrobiales bacterium]